MAAAKKKSKALPFTRYPAKRADLKKIMQALRSDLASNDPLRIGDPVVLKLRAAIVQAQRDMNAKLNQYWRGKSQVTEFDARQMRELQATLRSSLEQIDKLADVAKREKKSLAHSVAEAARGDVLRQVSIVRDSLVFDLGATPMNLQAAERVARGKLLLDGFPESAERYAGAFRSRIESELTLAMVKNQTIHQAATQLYTRIPQAFENGFYWAERMVRHETMNAYGQAHMEYYQQMAEEDPAWSLRWDSARDSRTCPICRSLHNQVRNIGKGEWFEAEWFASTKAKGGGKKTVAKKLKVKRAPAHIQCRCSVWPWRDEFSKYMDIGT